MAHKIYSSTLTHNCPKCNAVVKKEKNNDALWIVYVFLFIPVGLIALILFWIKTKKAEYNKYGEQIICCPNCHSLVAVSSNGGIAGYSRIIMQEQDLLEIVLPLIAYLKERYNIKCEKHNNDEKYSEMITLKFINSSNEYRNVVIYNKLGEIKMALSKEDIKPFDKVELGLKIVEILG